MTYQEQLSVALDAGLIKDAAVGTAVGVGARVARPLWGMFAKGFGHSGSRIMGGFKRGLGSMQRTLGKWTKNHDLVNKGRKNYVQGQRTFHPGGESKLPHQSSMGALHPKNWKQGFQNMWGANRHLPADATTGQKWMYAAGRVPAMLTYGAIPTMAPFALANQAGNARGWQQSQQYLPQVAYDEATQLMNLQQSLPFQDRMMLANNPAMYQQLMFGGPGTGRYAQNAHLRLSGQIGPQSGIGQGWDMLRSNTLLGMLPFTSQHGNPVERGRSWIDRRGADAITKATLDFMYPSANMQKQSSELEKKAFLPAALKGLSLVGKVALPLALPTLGYMGGKAQGMHNADQQTRGTVRAVAADQYRQLPYWQRMAGAVAPRTTNQYVANSLGSGYRDYYNNMYGYGNKFGNPENVLGFNQQFSPRPGYSSPYAPRPTAPTQQKPAHDPLNVMQAPT